MTKDTPKERAEEMVNLIISNTASQYSEEWKPDIVYTKEQLIEFVESFAKQEVERACKEKYNYMSDLRNKVFELENELKQYD